MAQTCSTGRPRTWRDFYFRIADKAPVSVVYLGETICSKRAPLFADYYEAVSERLSAAGKTVVHSTLGETASKVDRRLVSDVCERTSDLVEANDASAVYYLRGRPHYIGPLINVYNEETLRFLSGKGARNICLPVELPFSAPFSACAAAENVTIEVQVFGRQSLALSARCYHARAHGRTKDTCRFVCENDPDGLVLATLEQKPFLVANGVRTLSCEYLNLAQGIPVSRRPAFPVTGCRAQLRHGAGCRPLSQRPRRSDGRSRRPCRALRNCPSSAPFSNGFYHGQPGHGWTEVTGAAPH